MPKYEFICSSCQEEYQENMSIQDFISIKKITLRCEECLIGILETKISLFAARVDKSKDQIIIESKEEIRKTLDKVKSGDKRAIADVYGDSPNPYKDKAIVQTTRNPKSIIKRSS